MNSTVLFPCSQEPEEYNAECYAGLHILDAEMATDDLTAAKRSDK